MSPALRVPAAAAVVADAMLRDPKVHPADLTVAAARDIFGASAKTHMLLLARGGILLGTLTAEDLLADARPGDPALDLASLAGRTVPPGTPLAPVHQAMRRQGVRRLAVTGESGRLHGLLCLKRSQLGFCSDAGVAAMRRERIPR